MEQIFISPAQCRMARSLLNWTQAELAERCDLSPVTINKFEKSTGDQGLEITKLGTVHFRIIIKEGDTKLTATKFAEYRVVPEQEFGEVPFYIFDDNLVLIPFEENEMNLFIIKNSLLAKSYQKQFELSWKKAKKVGA